jgi:hypothetical protein
MKANEKSWYSDGQVTKNEESAECHDHFETDSGITEDQAGATDHLKDKSYDRERAGIIINMKLATGSRLRL